MDLGSLLGRLVPGSRGSRGAAASGGGAGASLPSAQLQAGSEPASARPDRLVSDAWRRVPALRPTVAEAPLVAPTPPFRAGLAAARPAPIALAALGHGRGIEAPAGLASGVAVPVARTPADPLPAPVRRGVAQRHAEAASGSWSDDSADGDDARMAAPPEAVLFPAAAPPPVMREAIVTHRRAVSPLVTAPDVAGSPAGRLGAGVPVVSRQADPDMSVPAAPAVTAQAGAAAALVPAGTMPSPTRADGPAVARLAAGATSDRGLPASAGVGPSTPPSPTAPLASAPARRLRLGPSLTSPAAARGLDAGTHTPVPGSGISLPSPSAARPTSVPPAQRAAGAAPDATPIAGLAGEASDTASPQAASGAATGHLSERAGAGELTGVAETVQGHDRQHGDVVWQGGVGSLAASPIVGTLRPALNPAAPAVAMRRAADTERPVPEAAPGTPSAALAALARADPSAALGGAGPSGEMGALAPAVPGPMSVARSADADAAPFTVARVAEDGMAGAPRLTWTNPWFPADGGALPGSRSTSGALPAPGLASPLGATGPAASGRSANAPGVLSASGRGPSVAQAVTAAPVISRQATGAGAVAQLPAGYSPRPAVLRVGPAVQASSPAAVARDESPAPVTMPGSAMAADLSPFVARAAAAGAGSEPPVTLAPLQRLDAGPDPVAAAAPGAGTPAAGGSPASAGPPSQDRELDELARRLYDRIGGRLRRDLLIERERAGSLVDRGF